MSGITPQLEVTPEVAEALRVRQPVVALESTILTHGMPYPDNLAMARSVEGIIRAAGAVPATIAVIKGRLRAGLDEEMLDALAQVEGAAKVSRADLPFAVARRLTGGTTVAATMIVAHLVGIDVFATGGIGGVHRGAETSFDESADLAELSRTDVIVVSAGAKAILDVPKTLERLETLGVPVVAYRTDKVPAFWSSSSPIAAPLRLDSAAEIADFELTRRRLGFSGGVLVMNPVPVTAEIPADEIRDHILAAQAEADAQGISGKDVTPFLLQRILELTDGRSLATNIALVEHNAALAAEIAIALRAAE